MTSRLGELRMNGERSGASHAGTDADWRDAPRRRHADWIKAALVAGLGLLSWVATYVGMLELIEANMGELPVLHRVIIGFSVGMLMLMIIWLLDQMFARHGLIVKGLYIVGYLFLTLISVGFGFGFYWKVLESRSEASRSAESAVGQVQGSLTAASTRLEQLQGTLVSLTAISTTKAEQERANGTSCPGSKPGSGPRRQMREDDASRFTFASDFVKGRIGTVKEELIAFESDIARISSNDASLIDKSGTRNEFMRGLSRKLDTAVTRFNAFRTDPQLKQIRNDLADRAAKTQFADTKGGTYACPDPQLTGALTGVVRAIDGLPELEKPRIAVVEGSEAVIEAFRRLFTTLGGVATFKLPPSPEELRALQVRAVQSVEGAAAGQRAAMAEAAGLGKRDYVPLFIAIFVDFCLLLVSIGRPMNRFVAVKQSMREAANGPVYDILEHFDDIHDDKHLRRQFELFSHVIYDIGGHYFAAVPLSMPDPSTAADPAEAKRRDEAKRDAIMLTNMFAALERQGVFHRNRFGLRAEFLVKRKLKKQASKFADAGAFRVYQFANGAWPEMILGATTAAARRMARQLDEAKQAKLDAQRMERETESKAKFMELQAELQTRTARAEMRKQRAIAEAAAMLSAAPAPTTTAGLDAGMPLPPAPPANDTATFRPVSDPALESGAAPLGAWPSQPQTSPRLNALRRAQISKRLSQQAQQASPGRQQVPPVFAPRPLRTAAAFPAAFGNAQPAYRPEPQTGSPREGAAEQPAAPSEGPDSAARYPFRPVHPFTDNVIMLPERRDSASIDQIQPEAPFPPSASRVTNPGDIILEESRRIAIPVSQAGAHLPESLSQALAELSRAPRTAPQLIEAERLLEATPSPAEPAGAIDATAAPWVGELGRVLAEPATSHPVLQTESAASFSEADEDAAIAARFAPNAPRGEPRS